jgi:hypothetical protein
MLAQARLHASDEDREILIARWILEPGCEGLVGKSGRAVDEVEAEGCER